MLFLKKTIALIGLVIFWNSNLASSTPFNLEQLGIDVQVVKKKNQRARKFKQISILKKLKRNPQEKGSVTIFVLGMLLSVTGLIFLLMGGGGAALFGFFGALLCFLAWQQSDEVPLFLVGVGLGLVGMVFGFRQLFNSRD